MAKKDTKTAGNGTDLPDIAFKTVKLDGIKLKASGRSSTRYNKLFDAMKGMKATDAIEIAIGTGEKPEQVQNRFGAALRNKMAADTTFKPPADYRFTARASEDGTKVYVVLDKIKA